jgi:small-conductance mechanosensitive channel
MLEDILQRQFLGNTVLDYLLTLLFLVAGTILIRWVFAHLILETLRRRLVEYRLTTDDTLVRIAKQYLPPFLYLCLFYLTVGSLVLPEVIDQSLDVLITIVATYLGINAISASVEYLIRVYLSRKLGDASAMASLTALSPMIRVAFWLVGVIFLLANLGLDVTSLVASLGVGGLAIGLAAQGILGDLFSYFSIVLDRPFQIGDFIIVGDYMGVVEYVGIKTTRLRSLGGEQLVMANTDITGSRVRNYKRMQQRRIVFGLGVTYETGLAQLEEIPKLIKEIIEPMENARFDRAHFAAYGDFSLNFEVVYYVLSGDFNLYMDLQQHINLEIKKAFEARDIEFAYPTQVLYVNSPQGNGNGVAREQLVSGEPVHQG